MEHYGFVAIKNKKKGVIGPVAVIRIAPTEFVGAFSTGKDNEDLTFQVFSRSQIDERTWWISDSPGVNKLNEQLSKLDPIIHKKVKSVLKKVFKAEEEEWTRSGST